MYLKYMGAEAYGLVGFFTMLQAWFNLLDMGLSPTVARETARYRGGATNSLNYRRFLRALQIIFGLVALLGGGAMFLLSDAIAHRWLNIETLSPSAVKNSLQLISVCVALRWTSGLYRGCISGLEKLAWLGGFNSFVATLRFLGAIPVLVLVGNSPEVFFFYQMLVAIVELIGLLTKTRSLLPRVPDGEFLGWSFSSLLKPIKSIIKFSLAIALTSSIWVLVTQTDKLVLSKLLALTDYGYFTLAVLAANGVTMISGPISGALMPRLARLEAEGDEHGLLVLYRNVTQMVAVIAVSSCLVLFFFAEQVLWIWTGDVHASNQAAPILKLYAIGNGFLAIAAFPYYLQFAKGDLRLHLTGSAMFLLFLVPSLLWATWKHGAIGAGYAWLCANAAYFFLWVPVVHRRFFKNLHVQWLLQDLMPISIIALALGSCFSLLLPWPTDRVLGLGALLGLGVVMLGMSALGSSVMRDMLFLKFGKSHG